MPSVILAGTTTGTALSLTSDTSGELQIRTNNGATTAMTLTTGGAAVFTAGTVSAPTITTTGDTNTGIFFPAADTIAFTEGGVEAMRIDSSGNVGIGVTSPTSRLDVVDGQISASSSASNNTGQGVVNISSNRNDGTKPRAQYIVSGSSYASSYQAIRPNTAVLYSAYADLCLNADTNNTIQMWTGGNERMRISSVGALLVNTTTNLYNSRLNVRSEGDNVTAQFYRQGTSAGSGIVVFSSNAGGSETLKSYIESSSGNLITISDERVKQNISNISYGLEQINALRPVSFEWKNGDGAINLGFIAQEVETLIPEAVTTLNESMSKVIDNQKMLNKDSIIPVLVKAIQELKAELDSVKAELQTLKGN